MYRLDCTQHALLHPEETGVYILTVNQALTGTERGEHFLGLPVHRSLQTQSIPWSWLGESQTACTSVDCFLLSCLKRTDFAWSCVPLVGSCLYHTPAYLRCIFLYLRPEGHQVHWVRVHWSCSLSQRLIWYLLLPSKIRYSYSAAAMHVMCMWKHLNGQLSPGQALCCLPQQITVSPVWLMGGSIQLCGYPVDLSVSHGSE